MAPKTSRIRQLRSRELNENLWLSYERVSTANSQQNKLLSHFVAWYPLANNPFCLNSPKAVTTWGFRVWYVERAFLLESLALCLSVDLWWNKLCFLFGHYFNSFKLNWTKSTQDYKLSDEAIDCLLSGMVTKRCLLNFVNEQSGLFIQCISC